MSDLNFAKVIGADAASVSTLPRIPVRRVTVTEAVISLDELRYAVLRGSSNEALLLCVHCDDAIAFAKGADSYRTVLDMVTGQTSTY